MSDFSIPTQPADGAGLFDAQPIIHYAPSTATTTCGIPLASAIGNVYTTERDLVAGCQECVAAAAAVPTSCPSCAYKYCECFEAGFAAGVAAAMGKRRPLLWEV